MKLRSLLSRTMSQYKHQFRRGHKARCKVIDKYETLPTYRTVTPLDPFEYKLSSKEEVMRHIDEVMDHVPMSVEVTQTNVSVDIFNEYQREVRLYTNVKYFKMSPLQKKRLEFLMGNTFNKETGEMKITCRSFKEREENIIRCAEILKELVLEAFRAPFAQQKEEV